MRRREDDQVTDDRIATPRTSEASLCAAVFIDVHSFALELPTRGSLVLGRSPEAGFQLMSVGVSRLHARLDLADGRAVAEDLGSRNGTFVNQVRIERPTEMGAGDELSIGAARLAFMRRSTLPAGVPAVLVEAAFVPRLDEQAVPVSLVAVQLEQRWYELGPMRDLVARLPALTLAGACNDFVLVFATPTDPTPLVEAITHLRARTGMVIAHGVAPAKRHERAAAQLRAVLDTLARAKREQPAPSTTTPVCLDPKMVSLHEHARRIARSVVSVLLVGETGAGKEVFARLIHEASGRTGPLVTINTAALPEALLESELFGHERGAFSGATSTKIGLFEAAHQGTLFLDEIGELPLSMQAKLLRVLEDHTVRRIGGTVEKKVDVRVIAATNNDLEHSVREKRFRSDLLYRLNASTLSIPPLRERRLEIVQLAQTFLRRASGDDAPLSFSPEALEILERYSWPGNVRELKNAIDRAVAVCRGTVVLPEHLPERVLGLEAGPTSGSYQGSIMPGPLATPSGPVRENVRDFERDRIVEALDKAAGNQTRAAEMLGLPRRTLAYKMARLGLRPPRT